MTIDGYTVAEMAKICGISPNTLRRRIYMEKIEPMARIGYTRVYDVSVLDKIRDVPSPGRPRQKKECTDV